MDVGPAVKHAESAYQPNHENDAHQMNETVAQRHVNVVQMHKASEYPRALAPSWKVDCRLDTGPAYVEVAQEVAVVEEGVEL